MFAIKTNIPAIMSKLDELKLLIDGGWRERVVGIIEEAAEKVADATPVSADLHTELARTLTGDTSGGTHIADHWKTHIIGGTAKSRSPVLGVVYNDKFTDPTGHIFPDAFMVSARGGRDYTLLHLLEYGTRPHVIVPRNATVLHFVTQQGDEVFTRRVVHPGTKAYGMIRVTRAWMNQELQDYSRQFMTKAVLAVWRGGGTPKFVKPRRGGR